MSSDEKNNFADAVQDPLVEDIFIEWIHLKYEVAKPIIREIASRLGKNLPKIFNELRKLGYAVPLAESNKIDSSLPKYDSLKFQKMSS